MSEEKKEPAVVKKEDQIIEYKAYGGDATVKLTLALIRSTLAVPTRAGNYPSDRDCYQFAMLCKARGLNPFEGDAFLVGYETKNGPKFNLITAHQAFLKRAELNPDYNGMDSGVVVKTAEGKTEDHPGDFTDDGETLVGGWARIHFKGGKLPLYRRIRLDRYQEEYGVWQENPETMIVKCAEADALRSSFPTKIGGLYLREELARIEGREGGTVGKPMLDGSDLSVGGEPPATVDLKARIAPKPEPKPEPQTTVEQPAPQPPPVNEPEPPQAEEPAGEVETGEIEAVSVKESNPKGKWKKYGVKVNGQWHATFDSKIGEQAQGLETLPVKITYTTNDKGFRDIVSIEAVEQDREPGQDG